MASRISELPNTATLNPADIFEVSVVDVSSPTGYSSRHARIDALPSSGGGALCRLEVDTQLTVDTGNFMYLQIPFSAFQGGCILGPTVFNSVSSATFRASLLTNYPLEQNVAGHTQADISYTQSDYSYIRFMSNKGRINTNSADVLPLSAIVFDVPSFGIYLAVYDVYTYDFSEEDRGFHFTLVAPSTVNYTGETFNVKGFIDWSFNTYEAA
jgi:hypothetical protein